MKVLLLDTSYPISSRNRRILPSIAKSFPQAEIHQIAWNRTGGTLLIDDPFVHVYNKCSPLGNLWIKAMNLLGYRHYAHSIIKSIKPDIIIASHWDTLILVPKLDRKKQKLIYENLDIPTGPYRKIICLLERRALKHTDLIIHASRFFKELYPQSIKQIVLDNKPAFTIASKTEYSVHSPLRIAYIGNVRYKDVLFNLIDAVREDERFHLAFHGRGVEFDDVKKYSDRISNIEMTGAYEYRDVAKMYTDADVVWAAYPNKDFNVKYATSNKFFESIFLGIPCLFAKETKLGDYVKKNGIGLVVDPYDSRDIKCLLEQIVNGNIDLNQIALNLRNLRAKQTSWDEDFKPIIDFIKS